MKNSSLLKINIRDLVKGFFVAVLTVIVSGLSTSLNTGHLPTETELKSLALIGLSAGGAYLLKNLFTNSNDQLLKKEPKDDVYKP